MVMVEGAPTGPELDPVTDARLSVSIAAAMREVAGADGEIHTEELALIDRFLEGVPADAQPLDGPITDAGLRGHLLRTLVALALADGHVSAPERAAIEGYARAHGGDADEVASALHDVALSFFGAFRGVHVFRDQALGIARGLGLTEDEAARVLDAMV